MELFPYEEFRPYQREIYEKTYTTLLTGGTLLINAPTGLGKTAAVISAAAKYILETGGVVHYTVRTRTELEPPVRELANIMRRGVELDYVVIKSRQDMCCYQQLKKLDYLEFLAECNLLKSMGKCIYYPPRDVSIPLKNVSAYIKFLCTAYSCPYEYAKARLNRAKLIISTYYYILGREHIDLKDRAVIIDEAHSIFDAVIHLYTVKVSETDVKSAYREAKKYGFLEEASKIYALLTFIRKMSGVVDLGDLLGIVEDLDLENAIWEIIKKKTDERINPYTPLILLRELKNALKSRIKYFSEIRGEDATKVLVLQPLDPTSLVKEKLKEAKSVIYISGTLPISLFSTTLGLIKYSHIDISFSEYIPRQNYLSIVDLGVTTKFTERSEDMYVKIAQRIADIINISPGGVLAVFPSYEVLKGVRKYLSISIPHWYEGSQEVDLHNLPDRFFIGAVARGRYAEGVEYVRDGKNLLSTVAVVGVPYPEPSPYLEKRVESLRPRLGEKAWNSVYLYYAIIAVRQAIGRLFRGPGDRGVLIFLDRRYAEPDIWSSLSDILSGSLIVNELGEAKENIIHFFTSVLKVAK